MKLWVVSGSLVATLVVVGCVSSTPASPTSPTDASASDASSLSPPSKTLQQLAVEGEAKSRTENVAAESTPASAREVRPGGLIIEDLVVGEGPAAEPADKITVHYDGTLADGGKKFDSSRDRGRPFVIELGAGRVIRGWDEGLVGMKMGGTRKLIIPPALAYGPRSMGGVIPPNSTLVFVVEMLKIERPSP